MALMFADVSTFKREVLKDAVSSVRVRTGALLEEVEEYEKADTVETRVDGMVDLTYFALGYAYEMELNPQHMLLAFPGGLATCIPQEPPKAARFLRGEFLPRVGATRRVNIPEIDWGLPARKQLLRKAAYDTEYCLKLAVLVIKTLYAGGVSALQVFREVHRTNMLKRLGDSSKQSRDAVKPDGWERPKLSAYVGEKFMVIGKGGCGKDELARASGLSFASSSEIALEKVVRPYIRDNPDTKFAREFAKASDADLFNARGAWRETWRDIIRAYNTPDPARLARDIFSKNAVYCGCRTRYEFEAIRSEFPISLVIWVVRPGYNSDDTTCELNESDADMLATNNGTLDDLRRFWPTPHA